VLYNKKVYTLVLLWVRVSWFQMWWIARNGTHKSTKRT